MTAGPSKQGGIAPLESVGWRFWSSCFVLSLAPCIYLTWQLAYEGVSPGALILFGIILAALVAGFTAVIVNTLLQARVQKRRKAEKRQAKKKTRAK